MPILTNNLSNKRKAYIMDNKIPTWEDFPAFYENPVIKMLGPKEKWTVSTTKTPDWMTTDNNKMPIDMWVLQHENRIAGAKYGEGHNPLVDLNTLCQLIPSATNNAYNLDAIEDGVVVLDIEPGCPDNLKNQFMKLPYIYAETSMSGQGIHMVFELPEDIINDYPDVKIKSYLREQNGYFEILLKHMVTFTRNALPPSQAVFDISAFRNVFEMLAMQAKPSSKAIEMGTPEESIDGIPYAEDLLQELDEIQYAKTIEDFPQKAKHSTAPYDYSAYEFGMCSFYYSQLKRIIQQEPYNTNTYTNEEMASIVYAKVANTVEPRSKHNQMRCGMPWLLFTATRAIAKSNK